MTAERTAELRRGWWGFSGFQATGMIKWGQISKPKKVPRASNKTQKTPWTLNNPKKSHAKFLSLKNLWKGKQVWLYLNRRTMWPRYAGTITNLQIVLNSQKNLYLSSHPKKYLPNFPTPKNPRIKNFRPKKKSVDYPCYLKSSASPLPSRAAEYLAKRILRGFWISLHKKLHNL